MRIGNSSFLRAGGTKVQLSNQSVSDVGAGSRGASYSLQSDGDVEGVAGVSTVVFPPWVVPKNLAGGNYECRATLNSGSLGSGTTGSWLALSSTRTWAVATSSPGTQSANLTIEIRLASTGVVLTSATITLNSTTI